MVLASCSPYFQAMFTSGMKESQWATEASKMQDIVLPGIAANGLKMLLEFLYTGKLELNPGNIQEVLACAAQLQIVSKLCQLHRNGVWDFFGCITILNISNTKVMSLSVQ